ncbi:PorT family protein [Fulvivirga sp. 29W222]|uniref:PorT family protein n=1 Tax=Fulvivirga marina TaxID=2494733 RepID=A0A937G464_9BACT|nr:porin family protein [Fulvivirga marina]MBL6449991.1 PorT family protein [Fulvivirga marina]
MFGRVLFTTFLFYTFISIGQLAYSQSCGETLNIARESFNAGHLYEIPSILKPCLDNGFNKDQRIEAYWLLTRTYLFIDDPISAEDSYLKLLKQDPEYIIDPERDPIDVVYLSRKFKTTPIFVLYAKIGSNLSTVDVIHNYGVDNTSTSAEKYKGKLGFQFGAGGEINANDNISLGLELNFFQRNYTYSNILFNSDNQTFQENRTGIDIPLFLKYRWDFVKIRPYVYAGVGLNYLLSAKGTVKLIDRVGSDEEDLTEIPVTGPEVDLKPIRKKINKFAHFGAGVNYRFGYNYLVVDLRYTAGLSNIITEDEQYSNSALLYKYGFVDDDKRLNNFSFSVGFVKPLYKARKIKKASVKGFFSRIF